MSGFRKSGVYPLNPGAVCDRQLALHPKSLSKFQSEDQLSKNASADVDQEDRLSGPVFTREEHTLFQTHYEEGYDVQDANYLAWLRIYHPCSIGSQSSSTVTSNPPSLVTNPPSLASNPPSPAKNPPNLATNPPSLAALSLNAKCKSSSSSDILNEVLVLPDISQIFGRGSPHSTAELLF